MLSDDDLGWLQDTPLYSVAGGVDDQDLPVLARVLDRGHGERLVLVGPRSSR